MINNQYECVNLSVIEKVVKADKPYYHKDEFCVVIEDNYITYGYGDIMHTGEGWNG